jgi:metallo-beta-lactamase class B
MRNAVLSVLLAVPVAALAQAPSEATVAKHVAEAQRLAGADLKPLLVLCKPAPAKRPAQADTDHYIETQIARPAPEPGKAFDNLYFVGSAWVSAWALTTSEGIILIDALNNEAEAAALIEGGMKKLGLDPAQIKYIVVTHAHGDHYGGAPYLAGKYKARVVMSEADWRQTETQLEFNSPHWGPVPKRDVSVIDGERLRLGDTTVTLNITPGHTLGTLTPIFEVRSGGETHRALLWGGTAFNFGKDIARLDMYIAATQRMAKVAHVLPVDVMLSNHAGYDGTVAKLEALRKAPGAHPFVIGTEAVERGLLAMGECAMAQKDRFLLQN